MYVHININTFINSNATAFEFFFFAAIQVI